MTGFCGVYLRPGVDMATGRRLVSAMLSAFGTAGQEATKVQPAAGLCLGFSVPLAFADSERSKAPVVDREGFVAFGDVTLWDRGRLDPPGRAADDLEALHAYLRRDGDPAAVSGDFACGLFDPANARLTLIRDQIGVRTIVYAQRPDGLVFASNARFLLGAGLPDTSPDPLSLAAYMVLRHPGAGRFYLKSMNEIPPAHCLTTVAGEAREASRYWSLEATLDHGLRRAEDCIEHVREKFVHAVEARLAGSRRPAVALSGGLDSSAVAGVVAALDPGREVLGIAHRPGPGAPADPNDDGPYIAAVADHWKNLRLCEVTSHKDELLAGAEEWYQRGLIPCPEPFFVGADAMTRVALEADADVLLDGLYGDNALSLAGGPTLAEALFTGRLSLAFREWRRLRKTRGHGAVQILRQRIIAPMIPSALHRTLRRRHWADAFPLRRRWRGDRAFLDLLKEGGYEAFRQRSWCLRDQISSSFTPALAQPLMFQDRAETDGSGFRFRRPMIDVDLLAAVYWTPVEHFVSAAANRELIREVAAPYLPEVVRSRPGKAPFMQDFGPRLAGRLPRFLEEIARLRDDRVWSEVVDLDAIRAFCGSAMSISIHNRGPYPDFPTWLRFVHLPHFVGRYIELRRTSNDVSISGSSTIS